MDRYISRSKRRKIDNDSLSTSQNVDKNVEKVETSPVLSVSEKIRRFSAISGDIERADKRSFSRTSFQSDITKNDITKNDILSERLIVSRKWKEEAGEEENSATDVRRIKTSTDFCFDFTNSFCNCEN
jgi:hypothetical protein